MGSASSSTVPVTEVTCPRCGRRTDRVQCFEAPVLLNLFVYLSWTHETVAGCPQCVHKRLWQLFWVNYFGANLLFPFVGPMILLDIRKSRNTNVPGIPPEFASWANLPPPPPRRAPNAPNQTFRMMIALVILAVMLVVMFFLLPRLAG